MADFPKTVQINEEGPREGFQIEKGPITTAAKIELVDSLSETGLNQIQVASFVSNKAVPQWADASRGGGRFQEEARHQVHGAVAERQRLRARDRGQQDRRSGCISTARSR